MALFAMRFDLRDPGLSEVSLADRYTAAVEMAAYAEERGFVAVVLSEHHGSSDGYLPSALTLAAAVAVRTSRIAIRIAALAAPLHDPIRLAEEAAVVDLLSHGRLGLVLANGYVAGEFEMFGVPIKQRVARTVETIETLQKAWTGEPFTYRDRTVVVRPLPHRPGGPPIELGGSSAAAARRAARLGLGFTPVDKESWQAYRDERVALGQADPGELLRSDGRFFHLADDLDAAWEQVAPHALHETNAYSAWLEEAGAAGPYRHFSDADALRASGDYRVLTPEALAEELHAAGPFTLATFHPLMGGLSPELGWDSLRRVEQVQRHLAELEASAAQA